MADIELSRAEAREGALPLVCIVCGHAGSVYRSKVLSCSPWWIYLGILAGLLPYLVLALVFNRRRRARAPFCELHKHHWFWRDVLAWCWLVLATLGFAASLLLLSAAAVASPGYRVPGEIGWEEIRELASVLCLGSAVGLAAWPILALYLRYSGIYASAITPESITLTPVPDEFVEAVRVQRQDRQRAWQHARSEP